MEADVHMCPTVMQPRGHEIGSPPRCGQKLPRPASWAMASPQIAPRASVLPATEAKLPVAGRRHEGHLPRRWQGKGASKLLLINMPTGAGVQSDPCQRVENVMWWYADAGDLILAMIWRAESCCTPAARVPSGAIWRRSRTFSKAGSAIRETRCNFQQLGAP